MCIRDERGHRKCMVQMVRGIILRPEQDGKVVQKLKVIPMVCKICDKHYGKFNRLHARVAAIDIAFKPKQTEESDAASDSSILPSIVQSVAIKVDERSANKKRKGRRMRRKRKNFQTRGNKNKTDSE